MTAKVYAVVNRKGGVGKTTTTITLAHGLAKRLVEKIEPAEEDGATQQIKGHVLIVDLDPQGNCATSLGLKTSGRCVSNLLTGRRNLKESIMLADRSGAGGPNRPNLWLLPSSPELADAKQEIVIGDVVGRLNRGSKQRTPVEQILERQLAPALKVFSYIVIDCPPTLDVLNESVYRFADGAIVPVKLDYLSAAGAAQHTLDINAAQEAGVKIKISQIVPTFKRSRERLVGQMLTSLQRRYGTSRVSTPIPQSVRVAEAPASGGLTIYEYDPNGIAAKAYDDLVDKVFNE